MVLSGTAVAAVLLGLIGIVIGGPRDRQVTARPTSTGHVSAPTEVGSSPGAGCRRSSATALALVVLTWDTGAESRLDEVRRVLGAADIAGDDAAGLVQDLDGYLPSDAAWQELARYRTRQRARITALRTPSSWPAIAAANPRLGDRTTAFTVHAIRRRSGFVAGLPSAATGGVTFTMFVTCPGSGGRFRLIRLSQLDVPLP